MSSHSSLHKILTAIFLLAILVISIIGYRVFVQGIKVDVDLKSLLPVDASSDGVINQVDQGILNILGDQLVIAIDAGDLQEGLSAAKVLDQRIKEIPHLSFYEVNSGLELINRQQLFLQGYHYHLLTPKQKQLLLENPDELLESAQMDILGFGASKSQLSLQQDPLGLFGSFWQQQIPDSIASVREGRLVFSSDHRHTLVQLLRLNAQSGNIAVQEEIAFWAKQLQSQFARDFPSVKLLFSGAVFHSAFATATAKKEVSIIGFGSIFGIIVLFLLAFRRIDILLLSVASIGFGCCSALVVVCFLFQEIHLIALVFGASLIGVAVDYSLHFVSKLQALTSHNQYAVVLRQLILPMALGLGTSILSYACLFQSNLKVLNEIAVFSMTGLLMSWLFVCVVYPVYFRKLLPAQSPLISVIADLPSRFWKKKYYAALAGVLLITLMASGFYLIKLSDEVKTFYKPPADLLASEQYLQKKLKNISLHQYLLLRASDEESLLQLEERVSQSLDQLVDKGELGAYMALSQQVPSIKTQIENRSLLKKHVYQKEALLDQLTHNLELGDEFSSNARAEFENADSFLYLDDWIKHARPDQKILWVGKAGNQVASIITLKAINNAQSLNAIADQHAILFVDKVQSISNSIHQLTSQAIKWLLISYLVIFSVFVIYFRRFSVLILPLVPLTASLLALAVLSCFSIPINLFHIFGCYLILGFGIDYAIFYFFGHKNDSAVQYGTFLAAMTSVMSFGFLSFSSTPMVQSFGLILLLGCVFSLLISPLAGHFDKQGRV